MTPRQRLLAALDCQPIDRLTFWPKLGGNYPQSRTGQWSGKTLADFHRYIGSDLIHWTPDPARPVYRMNYDQRVSTADGRQRITCRGPGFSLDLIQRWDEASQAWHPIEHPIKTADDVECMADWWDHLSWEPDTKNLAEARQRIAAGGDSGVFACGLPQSGLMLTLESLAGMELTHYLLADEPQRMLRLFQSIHKSVMRCTELAIELHPADFFWPAENTSTTVISVQQYEQFNAPFIESMARAIHAAGRRLILHMCGHLKLLLPRLARIPARGFEAFTAPTLGNTTLLDGRLACPDKCLIGGTHAMLWLRPANEIIHFLDQRLGELPHHRGIIVTSSGVMPPTCDPETIRAVAEWVRAYPVRND